MHFKLLLGLIFIVSSISCVRSIAKEEEKFERQVSNDSKDFMSVGDTLNYWGADSPKAGIFILYNKAKFLKSIGLKINDFTEFDKSTVELSTQISTSPLYNLEVYSIKEKSTVSKFNPEICYFINDNFLNAEIIFSISGLAFRIKEREWIDLDLKVEPDQFIFVRLSISPPFQTLENKSSEHINIPAMSLKNTESNFNPRKATDFVTCEESVFVDNKRLEPVYSNPDIVFQYN